MDSMADLHGTKSTGRCNRIPLKIKVLCYISYAILGVFGLLRKFLLLIGVEKKYRLDVEPKREGFVPLYRGLEPFFKKYAYQRICDASAYLVVGLPGPKIEIRDRISDDHNQSFRILDSTAQYINMGSYNYLGFSENTGSRVEAVCDCISAYGSAVGTTRHEYGTLDIVHDLEKMMAKFLGVEDSIVFGMGFATNTMNIPVFGGEGCLLISDELNHASLILGCKLSESSKKIFKHNDTEDLERVLVESLADGQPETHEPWRKIIILIEAIYSMEGSIVNLPEIIRLKKKYKAYLYMDEAHSIGALGRSGRGVCDHFGIKTTEVDLLMGTFTKSFAAAGGYVAGNKKLIDYLRANSHSFPYASSMAAPIAQQIILVLKSLMEEGLETEGKKRLTELAKNSRYFRKRLEQMGFILYGHESSPIVPLILFYPGKIKEFAVLARKLGVAVVVVGPPITSKLESRVRFCISASHSKEMLDETLEVVDYIGDKLSLKYSQNSKLKKTDSIRKVFHFSH
ncbi:serine palmitoyltransferase 2-like [Brevipalpus obovatus]|uniref:serine palmitoyltransferase 2-like n=1 Tax=Brevipalpus obovatus TaxID=246614 RepID=UPI003D9F5ED2